MCIPGARGLYSGARAAGAPHGRIGTRRRRVAVRIVSDIEGEAIMVCNMGSIDRVLRAVAGLALLSLLFYLDGSARWWGLLSIPLLATAAVGYCPPYKWMGIDTLGRTKETPAS